MWRSWVDRINTVNKNPSSDEHPNMSPEELHQRAQKQANLRDLFNQSQDLLMTESERTTIFQNQVLPAYCAFYDADPGPHVFETFYDIRTFIVVLARQLVSGIRSVPDTANKTESSKVLMDNIRSKLHLYYVLKAINISTFGPNVLITVMLQQRIPSVVIKLFRSFIDLPYSYYGIDQQGASDNNMASLEEAGNIVADTLKQCVKNPSVLTRLIIEDTFFLLLRLILAKPAEWIADNDKATREPEYMIWKHKALEILGCAHMNWDAAQYLYLKRWITMPTQLWRENIDKSRLGMTEYYEILISAELIYLELKMSIDVDFLDFYNELEQLDIYDTLATVLVSNPFQTVLGLKIKLSEMLVKFVYVGRCDRIPSAPDGLPYQHSDFVLPEFDITKDRIVRNSPAFQSLLSAFIYPNPPSRAPIKSRNTNPVPVELRNVLFEEMRSIIQAHPINYFIIERLNTLPLLIETMESYDEEIQKGIMDLISYVMCDLNFVPLKELAVLSLHLQNNQSDLQAPHHPSS
ncbi:hypothetical protein CLU79DRAFT_241448 [Phycomyces nitens]|nr:hypothetical protein CLU79DRAFT_241448 [Phycomyces nitens]